LWKKKPKKKKKKKKEFPLALRIVPEATLEISGEGSSEKRGTDPVSLQYLPAGFIDLLTYTIFNEDAKTLLKGVSSPQESSVHVWTGTAPSLAHFPSVLRRPHIIRGGTQELNSQFPAAWKIGSHIHSHRLARFNNVILVEMPRCPQLGANPQAQRGFSGGKGGTPVTWL